MKIQMKSTLFEEYTGCNVYDVTIAETKEEARKIIRDMEEVGKLRGLRIFFNYAGLQDFYAIPLDML